MKNSESSTQSVLPGLGIAAVIAAVATLIGRQFPILGSAMPAIVIGVLIAVLVKRPASWEPGLKFASKMVLQVAVVVLGTQLSLRQVAEVGIESFPVMISTLVVCLLAAWLLGRAMKIDADLNVLIGVGTAICGASAIAAVSPVVKARNEAIAYAVSTIFLFNVLAVLIFPWLGHALGLTQHEFGLFAGTAVNDTSSVVATAGIYGSAALSFAVVVKLVRTLMIIPISLGLAGLRLVRRLVHKQLPLQVALRRGRPPTQRYQESPCLEYLNSSRGFSSDSYWPRCCARWDWFRMRPRPH